MLPQSVDKLKARDDWYQWKLAIDEELKSLQENEVWTLEDHVPMNKIAVSSKWVFTIKNVDGSPRYKARLVAKGFSQRQGFDYIQKHFLPLSE